jgi:hypothetical protein
MNKVYNHPATGLPTVDFGGEPRQLGRLPSTIHVSGMALLRAAVPMVPRGDWKAIKRRDVIGPDFILDQKSHGSCVGHGAAGALMAARALAGATFQKLSGPYVYSWINGGVTTAPSFPTAARHSSATARPCTARSVGT